MAEFWLDTMAEDFDDAIEKKHLPGSNEDDDPEHRNDSDSMAYINTVKVRLISLGFLGKANSKDGIPDSKYIKAVKKFQKCVGLSAIDGWVGEKTWEILEFLCSFENNQHPIEWLESWSISCGVEPDAIDLPNNEAVLRAVYLRLYSMGFFDFDDKNSVLNTSTDFSPATNQQYQAALNTFIQFCISINIATQTQTTAIDLQLLKLIFCYDGIIEGISLTEDFTSLQSQYSEQLKAISRIELWLSGYDTAPGPDVTKTMRSSPSKPQKTKISMTKVAIKSFWRDSQTIRPFGVKDNDISSALFQEFNVTLREVDWEDNESFENEVKEILKDPKDSQLLSNQFANIASSIFDGVKRVLKSLFNWLKNKAERTLQLFTNIARYLSIKAREVYSYVRDSVVIIRDGINFRSSKISYASLNGVVAFRNSLDFDQDIIIDSTAVKGLLEKQFNVRSARSIVYTAATKIFRHLINIARNALSFFASSLIGWIRALLILRRVVKSIEQIKQEVDVVRKYM